MANVVFYSKMSIESLFISTLLCGDCLYHDHLGFIKIWDLEGTLESILSDSIISQMQTLWREHCLASQETCHPELALPFQGGEAA